MYLHTEDINDMKHEISSQMDVITCQVSQA